MKDCIADLDQESITEVHGLTVDEKRITRVLIAAVVPGGREDDSDGWIVDDVTTSRVADAGAVETPLPEFDLDGDDMSAGRRHRDHVSERPPEDVLFDRIRPNGNRHVLNVRSAIACEPVAFWHMRTSRGTASTSTDHATRQMLKADLFCRDLLISSPSAVLPVRRTFSDPLPEEKQ